MKLETVYGRMVASMFIFSGAFFMGLSVGRSQGRTQAPEIVTVYVQDPNYIPSREELQGVIGVKQDGWIGDVTILEWDLYYNNQVAKEFIKGESNVK